MGAPDPYLGVLAEHGFRSDDAQLFLASWERLESAYFERLAVVTAPLGSWRERFRAAATETAALVESHQAQARFLAVDALAAGELGRERQRAFGARLAGLVDSARDELAEPELVPESTAPWIVAMFFNRVYRRCARAGGPDLPSQLPELMFLAISAYFGTEAGLEELLPPS